MQDYMVKRRYRDRKLFREGFYELRRQHSRERRQAEAMAQQGIPSLAQIAHPENLFRVFDELKAYAGDAPGPDRITYSQLSRREIAAIMRELSKTILAGRYLPSSAREVRIPKASGGYRTLALRSILYRVIAKALAGALTPVIDGTFLEGSHGFRPGRGPWSMLVALERMVAEESRYIIAQDDIRQAFDNVPIQYVVEQFATYIEEPASLDLAEKILRGHNTRRTIGIDQGSALSPLALNVALHHRLDLPFSENADHPLWLRYADNLAYLCQSEREGLTATQDAQKLLQPIGMALKGTDGDPVDLRQKGAKILGLSIRWKNGRIQYELTEEAWTNLKQKLSETHMNQDIQGMAYQVIQGWMVACASAFEGKPEDPVLQRILRIAAEVGYRELSRDRLKRYLQSARDRWSAYKAQARKVSREERGESEGAEAPQTADRPGIVACPRPELSQAEPTAILAPV